VNAGANDGTKDGTGTVTVHPHPFDTNTVPNLRVGFTDRTWKVASGGALTLPVLSDWRDADGDPVTLVGAAMTPGSLGSVTTTQDGQVRYIAPVTTTGGTQTITYQVSDGVGAPVSHDLKIAVSASGDITMVAPTAEPDVVQAEVNQPITIHPLDNDLPGSDPTDRSATLSLAGNVVPPPNVDTKSDPQAGTVTVTASAKGTYLLDYQIAFGQAACLREDPSRCRRCSCWWRAAGGHA
jgi:hypothetical protein